MASFNVALPDKFSFEPNDWSKWITRFERFRIASELDNKPEETQVVTLIYSIGDDADDIFSALPMTADKRMKYDTEKSKLAGHFIIKRNVIFESAKFNLRFQKGE